MKYETEVKQILKAIGGKYNVEKVEHCMTRLRLTLIDLDKVEEDKIKKISIVKGVKINSGQLQIIIGGVVDEVCTDFQNYIGENRNEVKSRNRVPLTDKIIDIITSIFVPVIPVLVAGGLLKGILVGIQFANIMDVSNGTYSLLMMFSDAPFYFLPMFLAFTSAKRFGCNQYIAVAIAGIMLHPTYATLDDPNFMGISLEYINYSSTVFPIIVGTYIISWIERLAKKISPKVLSTLLVPLITIVLSAPIILIGIGPVVNYFATLIGNGVIWLFTEMKLVAGFVVGGIYPLIVFTGLHTSLVAFELQGLAQSGIDPIIATAACANAAIAGTTLMIAIKTRNASKKSLAGSSAVSAFIGITEPALYGVVSNYKSAIISTIIGGAIGGFVINLFGVVGHGIGPVPLAGIAVFFGDKFIYYLIGVCISTGVAMLVLNILGIKEEQDNTIDEELIINITAPVKGKVVELSEVNDSTFANGIMGKGVAIIPAEGKIYAPIDAKVTALFDSKHAIGLKSDKLDILIHVGIDTVKLNGQYFETYVEKEQNVKKGDLLLTFDIESIKKEGYDIITPVIITNTETQKSITTLNMGCDVDKNVDVLEIEVQ